MALSITGYVLEPPRIGVSNSPFTLSPNNLISNLVAFNTAYPSDESVPRTEYLIQVLDEAFSGPTGPDGNLSLPDAIFFWTKNEGRIQAGVQVPFQRFDYAGRDGRFQTLQGLPAASIGSLLSESPGPGSNTGTRLAALPAPILTDLAAFPIRLVAGSLGVPLFVPTITLVDTDGDFGLPAVGTVELSLATGNLNWNVTDLSTYTGLEVFYQRQVFAFPNETTGSIGVVGTDTLALNPIPVTGQVPLLKFGFGGFATVVEVGVFGVPPPGTVEWQTGTGLLNLNATDLVTYTGQPLIYDGVIFETFQVPSTSVGPVNAPTGIISFSDENEDIYFRIPGVVQFPETVFVDTFTAGKRGQVQIRRSTGAVRFSDADQVLYTSQVAHVVRPDVLIERGHSIRLFRTPIDPSDTSAEAKDVTSLYKLDGPNEAATLADPIIGQPTVFLPALPRDDLFLRVTVVQDTGSFVGELKRLDVEPPPVTPVKGYALDFVNRFLRYGERKIEEVQPVPPGPYGVIQLPNYPVFNFGLTIELEDSPGSLTWSPIVLNEDYILDYNSGLITFSQTEGTLTTSGIQGAVASGTVFTDTTQDFTTAGVTPDSLLVVLNGASIGVYTITAVGTTTLNVDPAFPATETGLIYDVRNVREILADRYFREVPALDPNTSVERINSLGITTNSPRLNINPQYASASRFRFGPSTFSTSVTPVADNSSFTAPGLLAAGAVEVSLETGDLNFSSIDVTAALEVFWYKTLTLGTDYRVQAGLGFIEFSERLLTEEQVFLTYAHLDDVIPDPDDVTKTIILKTPVVGERGAFLVSKELSQPHPAPTSTLSFNPEGHEVAVNPAPSAFRGGRPQVTGEQVVFDIEASTVTFLNDDQITDALPHGAIVGPDENVYIDYFIYDAIGGEKNLTVIQPPMATVTVVVEEGATSFTIEGDRTAEFAAEFLLRLDRVEVYLLAAPIFNGTYTTVNLDQTDPQAFRSDLRNPTLETSSGKVRRTPAPMYPSYFVTEGAAFDTIPRGSKELRVLGDVASHYETGVIVLLIDTSTPSQEYNVVEGAKFDSDSGRTIVTLGGSTTKQFNLVDTDLKYSVRPILATAATGVSTDNAPLLDLPFQVFRRVEGQVGKILTRNATSEGYTIDDSGRVTFTEALTPNEEWSIFYTGISMVEAGRSVRATWNFSLVPSLSNGLLNQTLKMEYSTYAPDTFFYRVETMTNFRGEVSEGFSDDAKASSPSQGPMLENSSGQQLFEKGNASLFFEEGHLANEDLIARPILKFYNDAINHLEDYLNDSDGRVVGDTDGRFRFDGLIDNPIRSGFSVATNQIDDQIRIYFGGLDTVLAYQASRFSRFFPTARRKVGTVTVTPTQTGEVIFNTGYKPLTSLDFVAVRVPFAMITVAAVAGTLLLTVDDANGSAVNTRPAFSIGQKITIVGQNGATLDGTGKVVTGVTPTTINLNGGVAVNIPAGSTIRLADDDATYPSVDHTRVYIVGIDVAASLNDGLITYIDASLFLPDPPFTNRPVPQFGEAWNVDLGTFHNDTAPFRFPALDGGFTTDDGDIQTRYLLSPQADSETAMGLASSLLSREQALIALVQTQTVDVFTGVGDFLSGTVTVTSPATFPVTPRAGDLLRFTSGANQSTVYRQVAVGSPTDAILFNSTGLVNDTGFTFTLTTVTSPITSGSGPTVSTSGTTFTDTSSSFVLYGVVPGHTVIITSGPNNLQRRQVISALSTVITLSSAFGFADSNFSYRVDNPINTFGSAPTSSMELWRANLNVQKQILLTNSDSEYNALNDYIDTVGSPDIVTGATGEVFMTSTFEDLLVNFETFQVATTDFLYIDSGPNAKFYAISSIDGPNQLTIEGNFTSAEAGIGYRILRTTGVTLNGLNEIYTALANALAEYLNVQNILTLTSTGSVFGDAGAFAHILTDSDATQRATDSGNRETEATADASNIVAVMESIDRLYDARYVWIDGRINLETGILVKKIRAAENRVKALENIVKNMLKLLTL